MKKRLIALLMATTMVIGLTACGGGGGGTTADTSSDTTTEATDDASDREEVTIEVNVAQVDWADAWDVMEERFEEQYQWINLEHVGLGEDANFLQTRLSTKDLPAIIQVYGGQLLDELVAQDLLVDLSNYECAAVMPQAYKDAYTYDGKLIAMCQGAAFSTMFFNMALLKEAGWEAPPTNWDELLKCCADVKEKTGVAPLTTAAGKHTTAFMLFEGILANTVCDEIGADTYMNEFMDGTFDFSAYPEVGEKLDAIAPYFLEGSAAAQEEDAITYMADGLAAMCLAGNWNATALVDAIATASGDEANAAVSLPPFGEAGKDTWISVSPEDGFAITKDDSRTEAEQEAVDLFFNWIFEAENFQLIQNARGTAPVITNMTDEYIVLPDAVVPVVAEMGNAPFVKMGFNLYTAEFRDAAQGKIDEVLSGTAKGADVLKVMSDILPKSYKNQ